MMNDKGFIKYNHQVFTAEQQEARIAAYQAYNQQRRSVREFSDRPIPREWIEQLISNASSAPSGANKQPWTFCAVSNPDLKRQIRAAAEKEEFENYHGRMSEDWLDDLKQFGTDWHKPFLEIAPWLIIVFRRAYDVVDGQRQKNYYVQESVGLACGFLLTAIHNAGLVSLTHTPSPMNFLQTLLHRPENEKPYLLIPVGYAADDAMVPDIQRKPLGDVSLFYE